MTQPIVNTTAAVTNPMEQLTQREWPSNSVRVTTLPPRIVSIAIPIRVQALLCFLFTTGDSSLKYNRRRMLHDDQATSDARDNRSA